MLTTIWWAVDYMAMSWIVKDCNSERYANGAYIGKSTRPMSCTSTIVAITIIGYLFSFNHWTIDIYWNLTIPRFVWDLKENRSFKKKRKKLILSTYTQSQWPLAIDYALCIAWKFLFTNMRDKWTQNDFKMCVINVANLFDFHVTHMRTRCSVGRNEDIIQNGLLNRFFVGFFFVSFSVFCRWPNWIGIQKIALKTDFIPISYGQDGIVRR